MALEGVWNPLVWFRSLAGVVFVRVGKNEWE